MYHCSIGRVNRLSCILCRLLVAAYLTSGAAMSLGDSSEGADSAFQFQAAPNLPPEVALADSLADSVAEAIGMGYLLAHASDGHLEKGPAYRLEQALLEGVGPEFSAKARLEDFKGVRADRRNISAVEDRLRRLLLDTGHLFATLELGVEPGVGEATAVLRVRVVPADNYKLGGLKALGTKTDPQVLQRLSLLRFGEDFSASRLDLARARLSRLGYYEAVEAGPWYRDSSRNLIHPALSIRDLQANRIAGVLGYDSESPEGGTLQGFFDLELQNLMGTARDLQFHFAASGLERKLSLDYREPWLPRLDIGARLGGEVWLQDSTYAETRGQLDLFQALSFVSEWALEFLWQSNRYPSDSLRKGSQALATGMRIRRDTRDYAGAEMSGSLQTYGLRAWRRELRQVDYFLLQASLDWRRWFSLNRRHVVYLRVAAGGNLPLEGENDRGELHALGGAGSLRGYRDAELLTNLYGYANFEFQRLLAQGNRIYLFMTPGLVNRLSGDVHWRRVAGYGLGFDLASREWILGLSYALSPQRSPGEGLVHVRVENRF